jgi:uncharacterized protein (TIGR00255 family)
MQFYSMTGFGRAQNNTDSYTLTVEIKSVNNRFKDIRFKMPHFFLSEEIRLRKKIEQFFKRGSFDIYVNYKKNNQTTQSFNFDEKKILDFTSTIEKILNKANVSGIINYSDFLRNDFQMDEEETLKNELTKLLDNTFDQALSQLTLSRAQEGAKLIETIRQHLINYKNNFQKLVPLKEQYKEMVNQKLTTKLKDRLNDIAIDDIRYHQEVVYYLERYDIDEELNRITTHLESFNRILQEPGELGRKLDFLLQEFNRETNTIGSKSAHQEISTLVVDMKMELEKIREQALNLE